MLPASKANTETRGRPKKEEARTLSPIYKEMFSDNSAIIHSCFLIYVFEVFVDTKNEKRVGHKDGGFTLYDKVSVDYCFDNFEQCLRDWGLTALLEQDNMKDFVKLLPALGPSFVLREICCLINLVIESSRKGSEEVQIIQELTHKSQDKLNEDYPYMRFTPRILRELKMDKNDRWERPSSIVDIVKQRVEYLWEPLIRIITHTILNCVQGKNVNKFFKPFFSDAENSSETYIGQLNLDQVVMAVRRMESLDKSNRGSEVYLEEENVERMRKVRSIAESDGTRTIVQIIKAPQGIGSGIGMERKNTEPLGLCLESPAKIVRLQSEPLIQVGGFSTVFKPRNVEKQQEDAFKLQETDKIFNEISEWKLSKLEQPKDILAAVNQEEELCVSSSVLPKPYKPQLTQIFRSLPLAPQMVSPVVDSGKSDNSALKQLEDIIS